MTPYDYFDLGVVLFLLLGAFWGLSRGFISTLSILLASSVGVLAAHRMTAGALAALGLEPTSLMNGIAWFALFGLASMLVYQIMHVLELFVRRNHLGTWNRVLGLVFGGALSLMLCWIAAWALTSVPQTRPAVTRSRSAKYLVQLAEFGKDAIPLDRDSWEEAPSSFAAIPETFIDRVKEDSQKTEPQTENPDGNAQVHEMLDSIDQNVSKILIPQTETPQGTDSRPGTEPSRF